MIVKYNEPLYKHSTFKIGGEAKVAYFPESADELVDILGKLDSDGERYIVIGNGSNMLFDDLGFDGAVVFTKNVSGVTYTYSGDSVFIEAECGKLLTELSREAGKTHSLTGLEFAYGIPATVGGAVFMNAGAYGGQMSDVVISTKAYDKESRTVVTVEGDAHHFAYRHSAFEKNRNLTVLSTTMKLKLGDAMAISEKMDTNMQSRRDKQPLEYPSAGSTFKRPVGYFAAKLIDDCALKGVSVGGAEVSEKHAGFVVNKGGATSADVLELMALVSGRVFDTFGVKIEPEIIYVPYK